MRATGRCRGPHPSCTTLSAMHCKKTFGVLESNFLAGRPTKAVRLMTPTGNHDFGFVLGPPTIG